MGVLVHRARAHPVRAGVVAGVTIVALAVAWFLVSPLFIRWTLVETGPAAASAPLARGEFNEIDAVHKGRGQALLIRNPDGRLTVRLEDFSVTNGPDLYLYLSRHATPGSHDEVVDGISLGRLKAPEGAFSQETEAPADPSEFKSVVVYCRAFRTTFSIATLQGP